MCGLCGALSGEDHWTTGLADPEQAHHERRRARAYRVSLINRALASRRISVEDFQGAGYVLITATGKQEIVRDLGGVWHRAETMVHGTLDPLDINYLQELAL
jgi:hypothetical protein